MFTGFTGKESFRDRAFLSQLRTAGYVLEGMFVPTLGGASIHYDKPLSAAPGAIAGVKP